uniref:Beta-1,4-mannosyltransferase n=1 Tax=Culicoides sonorensis TaxID=179676 RepID=A0A336M763_CULSO
MTIKNKVATVVVVGDIGRSPRMNYHVMSLLEHDYYVNIVGYLESSPIKEIAQSSKVCYFMCLLGRTRFIIDFHNYTYSILSLTNHSDNILVKTAKKLETFIGRLSHANFCVTNAMKEDLENKFNIKATVLYDRPPQHFKLSSIEEKHSLFLKLADVYTEFKVNNTTTPFTEEINGVIQLRENRSALLVSSTSWTSDEDFGILLSALEKYEQKANIFAGYPEIFCVITGKGPLKDNYAKIIRKKEFEKVKIIMPWLEIEDYPKMLGAADLGVCLHYSSSGLDLPMKVVDMFGCGLPVCAIGFKCLNELVRDKETGFVFNNEDELAEQLLNWFYDFPNYSKIQDLKQTIESNLKEFQELRWQKNWNLFALPVIEP